ncbi:MAG: HIT domain-containing protein [bacterium]|nr:HIT domain-containing protein [bacterium]
MASEDCVFCKIVRGEIPSKKEYEDEDIIVFQDIHPKAPVHLLIVPKEHLDEFYELQDLGIWAKMSKIAQDLVRRYKLEEKGYRLVNNGGGANLITHLHLHLLGDIPHTREI